MIGARRHSHTSWVIFVWVGSVPLPAFAVDLVVKDATGATVGDLEAGATGISPTGRVISPQRFRYIVDLDTGIVNANQTNFYGCGVGGEIYFLTPDCTGRTFLF